MAYMSTINTASHILLSSSTDDADAVEVQGCLGALVICGFAQVAPDFTWLSFFFLDVTGVWRMHVQRCVLLWPCVRAFVSPWSQPGSPPRFSQIEACTTRRLRPCPCPARYVLVAVGCGQAMILRWTT
jgi:hypothetical protein